MMSQWDIPGIVDRFRELVAEPEPSFAQIATILCMEYPVRLSRNACIGKAQRMGLCMPGPKKTSLLKRGAIDRKPARPGRDRTQGRHIPRKTFVELFGVIRDSVVDLPPDQSPFAVSLLEAKDHHCRWPVTPVTDGMFMFCGDEVVPNRSWCPRHAFRAYERPRSERRAAA